MPSRGSRSSPAKLGDQRDPPGAGATARLDKGGKLDRGRIEAGVCDEAPGDPHVPLARLLQAPLVEAGLERLGAGEDELGAGCFELRPQASDRQQLTVDGRDQHVDRALRTELEQEAGETGVIAARQDRALRIRDDVEAGGVRVDVRCMQLPGPVGALEADEQRVAGWAARTGDQDLCFGGHRQVASWVAGSGRPGATGIAGAAASASRTTSSGST